MDASRQLRVISKHGAGIDTIDITQASTDYLALNHSSYAEKSALLKDIGLLLLTGERPPDRRIPDLADAAARRQPRQLSPRSGDDDDAADGRDAGEADGHDCLLQGDGIGGAVMRRPALVVPLLFLAASPRAASGPTIEQFLSKRRALAASPV